MINKTTIEQKNSISRRTFLATIVAAGAFASFGHLTKSLAAQSTSTNVVLAIYAPIGSDQALYLKRSILENNLALLTNHNQTIQVRLLIDDPQSRVESIDIKNGAVSTRTSKGVVNMNKATILSQFITDTRDNYPQSRLILIIEGHGIHWFPHLDASKLPPTGWTLGPSGNYYTPTPSPNGLVPLPMKCDVLPNQNNWAPSSWELGDALRDATNNDINPIDIMVLNNCFRMSLETVSELAPYVKYIVGYSNYNFFSAGATYQEVFQDITINYATLNTSTLAHRFALANQSTLTTIGSAPDIYPTIGSVIDTDIFPQLTYAVDALALALIQAINQSLGNNIVHALNDTQRYDSSSCFGMPADFILNLADELIDLGHFAHNLQTHFLATHSVHIIAQQITLLLQNIKVYGDLGQPSHLTNTTWDFTGSHLSLSLFFPKPTEFWPGIWHWLTPWYLDKQPTLEHPRIIDFLQNTHWIDFILRFYAPIIGVVNNSFLGVTSPCMPYTPIADNTD